MKNLLNLVLVLVCIIMLSVVLMMIYPIYTLVRFVINLIFCDNVIKPLFEILEKYF